MGIQKVSLIEGRVIEKERLPIGVFLVDTKVNGKVVGINNESGDAEIKTFETESQCIKWLGL